MEPKTTGKTARSPSWSELLGSDHWSGLLDPLDISLRGLLLQCGDLCQVTYDSFNSDTHSKYCGSCRYGKRTLLHDVFFPGEADYEVYDYLYATSEISVPNDMFPVHLAGDGAWSKDSNWMGYVAVSTSAGGRRVIYVVWRGTIRTLEWLDVFKPEPVEIDTILSSKPVATTSSSRVMKGWYVIYTASNADSPYTKLSARDQLTFAIKALVEKYKEESLSIVCVGHSLGATLAVLSAFDIVENGLSRTGAGGATFPVCAVVFGSPQVGNRAFNQRLEKLPNLRVLQVRNKTDLIPKYPSGLLGFVDTAGTVLEVDCQKSPYLKQSSEPRDWHNLQGILHVVAGWNGTAGEFELRVKRSVALVNKSSEFLKDEYLVPGSWWVEKNKGMVLGADGEWSLTPPPEGGIPTPLALKPTGKILEEEEEQAGQ
ncbi:LOW QUALITY PROTEIN: phospholipase A1-II 5-like [Curcuma longa]|uniref:LOW QUALITY PROTEIN: phospholipase A1-II 5-like n=1 Tax=Curcuma longa TaxID=136217 RepID=UPI003D9EDDA1